MANLDMLKDYAALPAEAKDNLRQDPQFGPMIQEFEALDPGAQANIIGGAARQSGTILDTLAGPGKAEPAFLGAFDMPELTPEQSVEAAKGMVRYGGPIAAAALTGGASLPIQAAAQVGAEGLSQAVSGEKLDPLGLLLAGAAPSVARGVVTAAGKVGRGLTRLIPGTGQWFHEMAHQTLSNTVTEISSALGSVDEAFIRAAQTGKGIKIPLEPLRETIKRVGQDEAILRELGAESGPVLKRLEKLTEGLGDLDSISIAHADTLRKRFGEWVRESATKGGPRHGVMKSLYRGVMDSIEEASGTQAGVAVRSLKDALQLTKVTKGLEELTDVLQKRVFKEVTGSPDVFEVVPKNLLREFRLNKDLVKQLGPDITERIRKTAMAMEASLPRLRGGGTGSGMLVLSGITAGAGAAAGAPLGAAGAMVGGATGAMAGPALHRAITDRLARMMLTERGRNFLAQTFKESKGTLQAPWLTMLFAETMPSLAELGKEPTLDRNLKTPSQTPKSNELEKMFFGGGVK